MKLMPFWLQGLLTSSHGISFRVGLPTRLRVGMSASALPSFSDLQGVATVADVLQTLHLAEPLWQAFIHQVGDPGPHIRILAALPRTVVIQGCVQATLTSGDMLTAVQATHVGLVWRTCRKVVHAWAGLPEEAFVDVDPWANEATDKLKEQSQGNMATSSTQVKDRILKMSSVVDQADDSELLLASRSDLDKWANAYVAVMGAAPLEEEEPNEAQLSALHKRVYVLRQPPYADFGVWLPFARRTQKAQKFRAFMPVGDGTYVVKEMPGPQNMLQWLSSWKVYKVALIMLDAASLAALQLYEKTIERLVMQWPKCWHLIVLADDKGRAERLEKLRRRFVVDEAGGRQVPSDWDKDRPWTCCFKALALDNEYWDEQVRHPAAAWLVSGGRGVALAPSEQVALSHLPGGLDALEVDKEDTVEPRRKQANRDKRLARAKRIKLEREELDKLRKLAHGGQGAGSSKSKGKGKSKAQAGVQICYSFANGSGPCGNSGSKEGPEVPALPLPWSQKQ